jgi:hypothetical protein
MPRPRKSGLVRRIVLGIVLSGAIILGVAGYWAWRMSWQTPAWYAPPPPRDARIVQRADDAEYRLLQQSQQVRHQDETWTLTLSEGEINAWLASRLPAWIEHDANLRWPSEIGTPQVLIESDGLSIAVPVTAKGVTRTVVAKLQPQITGEGANARLSLPLRRVSLGKVWIPGEPLSRLVDSVRQAAPEFLDDARVQQAIEVLAGRQTLAPVHHLSDGRRVHLTDVRLERGAIKLTARTLTGTTSATSERASP